jgi:hypothetical protein
VKAGLVSENDRLEIAWNADPRLMKRLTDAAPINPAAKRTFAVKLAAIITNYRISRIADAEEHPGRIVAALKPGPRRARKLLDWLTNLPLPERQMVEPEFAWLARGHGSLKKALELLIANAEGLIAAYRKHVRDGRPVEDADQSVRLFLIKLIEKHAPNPDGAAERERATLERKRRAWTAHALKSIGARFPHEKREKRRFVAARRR